MDPACLSGLSRTPCDVISARLAARRFTARARFRAVYLTRPDGAVGVRQRDAIHHSQCGARRTTGRRRVLGLGSVQGPEWPLAWICHRWHGSSDRRDPPQWTSRGRERDRIGSQKRVRPDGISVLPGRRNLRRGVDRPRWGSGLFANQTRRFFWPARTLTLIFILPPPSCSSYRQEGFAPQPEIRIF